MKGTDSMIRLTEMAYERSDAIDECSRLGNQFILHFKKLFTDNTSFHHHCTEMQSYYDKVYKIVLKYNKKKISNNQLIDWFFTVGSSTELLFDNDNEEDIYNMLMVELLANEKSTVEDIMTKLLK